MCAIILQYNKTEEGIMDIRVSVQAMYYIAKCLNKPVDKLTLLKLVFFADRYHLRKYARTITDDTYFALQYGPVASNTKDVLDDLQTEATGELYAQRFIHQIDLKTYQAKENNEELDYLSETDIEALNFAIENFGSMGSFDLVNLAHEYPEWKRFEHSLKSGMRTERMNMDDFFEDSILPDDKFKLISREIVETSKAIYNHG
jgi:uncharacterized phage-associated protein